MTYKFLALFFVIIFASYVTLNYEEEKRTDEYLKQVTINYNIMYESLFDKFEEEAQHIYDTVVNQDEIIEIYKQLDSVDNDILREKLYLLLKDKYDYYQKAKLKQLHFHTNKNISFLRMHMPSKHSDDLSEFRDTVAYVNQHKKYISGFEAGKIYTGMRYVFPLSHKGEHLGSVEVSFDITAFTKKFMDSYKVLCNFYIKKDIINTKTWSQFIKEYYIPSPFEGFYIEKDMLEKVQNKSNYCLYNQEDSTNSSAKKEILSAVQQQISISFYEKNLDTIFTVIPVLNPVTKKTVAFFTVKSDAGFIHKIFQDFYIILASIVFLSAILLLLLYKVILSKNNANSLLKELVDEKTKELNIINHNLEETVKHRTKELEEYIRLVDENIITSSTDLDGVITYASQSFCEISGYSKNELIGKKHNIIKHDDTPKHVFKSMWEKLSNGEIWTGEVKNKKKNGDFYWVKAKIYPLMQDGKKIGYTAIRQDITNKKLLEKISITDALTDIYNRRYFNDVFPDIINSAKESNELLSFIIMDIDFFKQYNDTYGHHMGDDVLINVAKSIKSSLKKDSDLCFRLGGEEFGVIYKPSSYEDAKDFANSIRENIENLSIEHKKSLINKYITVSVGVMCQSADAIESVEEIYKKADELLYKAKENGKNKVVSN
jgi:diguanylate cyclase (GGDEF)-like protein/PAS domain S-box-containing protein